MNGRELLMAVDQISKDKGITRSKLLDALETALKIAARRKWGDEKINVELDPETGDISVVSLRTVVETVKNPKTEVSIDEANVIDPEAEMGDQIGALIDISEFGRVAAQTVKQVIFQKVKEAEGEIVIKEYGGRVGDIINGIVIGQERGNYIVDLGRTEASLPYSEQIPREKYKNGDRVRAFILDVRATPKGPEVVLSRACPGFVRRLFELEVPEISENIVEIKGVVREAGDRTKIAVFSKDRAVDPVGACVGIKGSRVQSIVRELRGEKIDIITWSEDPRALIAEALSPAEIEKIGLNVDARTAVIVVTPQQLSLAIGKKGQNVRLASKLTGWRIDIMKENDYQQAVEKGTMRSETSASKEDIFKKFSEVLSVDIGSVPWIGEDVAELLKNHGIHTIEDIARKDLSDLINDPQMGESVKEVVAFATNIYSKRES